MQFQQSGIEAARVCFEITETAVIANMISSDSADGSLRDIGCHFALDDFGSGLSSFAYLNNCQLITSKSTGALCAGCCRILSITR